MSRPQTIVLPAAILGCLVVAWLGTTAVIKPPQSQSASPNQPTSITNVENQLQVGGGQNATTSNNSTSCSLNSNYPNSIRKWCSLIEQNAAANGIPESLVAAVMLEESGGNPDAYSVSGAVGLMQVMPSDGLAASFQCANGPCFAKRPATAQLLDPSFNIAYGTGMLANLIRKYGSQRDGLRAYGPMDVGYAYADIVLSILDSKP